MPDLLSSAYDAWHHSELPVHCPSRELRFELRHLATALRYVNVTALPSQASAEPGTDYKHERYK
jgi:hypothetical protein